MPKILEKCAQLIQAEGHDQAAAYAISRAALSMAQDGTGEEIEKLAKELSAQVKAGLISFALPETKSVNGVEIFAAGTWNGDKYTIEDIDQLVLAFNETGKHLPPYLKLGHSKKQTLLQQDGYPAAGWVGNLRRVGEKLVADFRNIPAKLHDLILTKAYRTVSAEIFWNFKVGEKVYPKLLKAVALLGADTPGVQTLDDIIQLYASHGGSKQDENSDAEARVYELELKKEDSEMPKTLEQLQQELADKETQLSQASDKIKQLEQSAEDNKTLTAKVTELSTANKVLGEKLTDMDSQVKSFALKARTAEAEKKADELIRAKNITPAQREYVVNTLASALAEPAEKKYKQGDKEVSAFDYHVAMFALGTVDVKTSEESEQGHEQTQDADNKIKEYITKQGKEGKTVTYKEAMKTLYPKGIPVEAQTAA